jgi:hypothetical protein
MTDQNSFRDIPIEGDEIDAALAAAKRHEATPPAAAIHEGDTEGTATFDAAGRLLRTVITTKDFLAGSDAFTFVNGLPKGSVATLGTLAGEIYGVEKKVSDWQGKQLTSYWLKGTFEAVVASTGEVFTAGEAILPRAYGVQVYNAFKDLGVRMITLGCTVGLRLSGRTGIPYEWVVRDHMMQGSTQRVSAISQQLGQTLGIKPAIENKKTKQIAAK